MVRKRASDRKKVEVDSFSRSECSDYQDEAPITKKISKKKQESSEPIKSQPTKDDSLKKSTEVKKNVEDFSEIGVIAQSASTLVQTLTTSSFDINTQPAHKPLPLYTVFGALSDPPHPPQATHIFQAGSLIPNLEQVLSKNSLFFHSKATTSNSQTPTTSTPITTNTNAISISETIQPNLTSKKKEEDQKESTSNRESDAKQSTPITDPGSDKDIIRVIEANYQGRGNFAIAELSPFASKIFGKKLAVINCISSKVMINSDGDTLNKEYLEIQSKYENDCAYFQYNEDLLKQLKLIS